MAGRAAVDGLIASVPSARRHAVELSRLSLVSVPVLFHLGQMAWTEEQLDNVRDRLSLAKRQGLWLSAREIWIMLDLVAFWRRSTRLAGHDGVATGMLPTIAEAEVQGIHGIIVQCRRQGCGNRRRLAWSDLGLPETTVFVEIGRARRFRCYRCRGCEVIISADWPRPKMGLGDR